MAELFVGNPTTTVLIHSYSRDMAEVLWTRLVKGSVNFLPRRGSRGHKAPNYRINTHTEREIILMYSTCEELCYVGLERKHSINIHVHYYE